MECSLAVSALEKKVNYPHHRYVLCVDTSFGAERVVAEGHGGNDDTHAGTRRRYALSIDVRTTGPHACSAVSSHANF